MDITKQAHYPDLAGRTAIVTGGSRGIGAATAAALAANGVAVAVVGRDETALTAVTDGITGAGGTARLGRRRLHRARRPGADGRHGDRAARPGRHRGRVRGR